MNLFEELKRLWEQRPTLARAVGSGGYEPGRNAGARIQHRPALNPDKAVNPGQSDHPR